MRTPEEQQKFLTHDRFGEGPTGKPIRTGTPKLISGGCLTVIAVIAGWIGVMRLGHYVTATVAQGERTARNGTMGYGYTVEKYRWNQSGLKVHIWVGSSMDLRFDVPSLELRKVSSQSWLAGNTAVLIGLDCVYHHNSTDEDSELGLLYDFERGELHTCGDSRAWFVWPVGPRKARQMSCDELRTFAKTLN